MRRIIFCLIFVVIFLVPIYLFLPKTVFSAVLFSTDFESGDLSSWSSSGGGAVATISAEIAHSGLNSIKIQHNKTSSYGFQTVIQNIEGGVFYDVSGYGNSTDSGTGAFFIRLAWYSSADGSGSQLSYSYDSNAGNSTTSDWQHLSETVQSPIGANSAKIRLVLNSKTQNSLASAYFDDILFQESTYTPTPSPTNSPTPTPTPPPTKSPTPSPTKSPTPIPTKMQIPASTDPLISTNSGQDVLGIQNTYETPAPSPKSEPDAKSSKLPFVAIGFVLTGVCLIGFAIFNIIKGLKKGYNGESEKQDSQIS
jgi:hypothetical protein